MDVCKKLNKHTEHMELLQANIVETLAAWRLFMLLRDHYEMTIEPSVFSKADIYDDIFDQETQCIIAAADKVSPGIPLEEISNEFTPPQYMQEHVWDYLPCLRWLKLLHVNKSRILADLVMKKLFKWQWELVC